MVPKSMAEKSNISDVKNWSIMILNSARPNEYELVTNTVREEYSMRMSFQKIICFSFRGIFVLMFVKV